MNNNRKFVYRVSFHDCVSKVVLRRREQGVGGRQQGWGMEEEGGARRKREEEGGGQKRRDQGPRTKRYSSNHIESNENDSKFNTIM